MTSPLDRAGIGKSFAGHRDAAGTALPDTRPRGAKSDAAPAMTESRDKASEATAAAVTTEARDKASEATAAPATTESSDKASEATAAPTTTEARDKASEATAAAATTEARDKASEATAAATTTEARDKASEATAAATTTEACDKASEATAAAATTESRQKASEATAAPAQSASWDGASEATAAPRCAAPRDSDSEATVEPPTIAPSESEREATATPPTTAPRRASNGATSADDVAAAAERAIADEERRAPREAYDALIARLSRQSVNKRYEAFRDIDWDAPDFAVRDDDLRWELGPDDPLGGTAWYRAKPPTERARIGLYRVATFMKVGVQFENVLSRGLLNFILTRSEQSPEHRYAYHELIEESHHSMMFSEFVRRSGFDVNGLTPRLAWLGTRVAGLASSFPELFFVFVLGGEDPIDHAQRLALSGTKQIHPLLRKISQIHITEEARHLCFARSFLREYVPRLHPLKRMALAATAPVILRITAELMLRPPPALIREFAIPAGVVDEAFTNNRAYREVTMASLAKVHALMRELGLVTRRTAPLWRTLGAA